MKKLLSLALACLLLFSLSACGREPKDQVSDAKACHLSLSRAGDGCARDA